MNIIATPFNLFGPDMIVIFLIVLLLFGAKKLPELAKGMGQAIREFNSAKDDVTREINKPASDLTVRKPAEQQPYVAASAHPAPTEAQAPAPVSPPPAEPEAKA